MIHLSKKHRSQLSSLLHQNDYFSLLSELADRLMLAYHDKHPPRNDMNRLSRSNLQTTSKQDFPGGQVLFFCCCCFMIISSPPPPFFQMLFFLLLISALLSVISRIITTRSHSLLPPTHTHTLPKRRTSSRPLCVHAHAMRAFLSVHCGHVECV